MDTKTVGNFIAELRKENNLTQKQLAEKLSVTDKAISRWETGKGYPDIEILASIAEVFDISLEELLSGKRLPPQEREVESQKQIVTAYKEAKKEKKRGKRWIIAITAIALTVVMITLLVTRIFMIDTAVNGANTQTIIVQDHALSSVMAEADSYIKQNVEPSLDLRISIMYMFVYMDSQVSNFAIQCFDPIKKTDFQVTAYSNVSGDGAELIVPEKLTERQKLFSHRLDYYFKFKEKSYLKSGSNAMPYSLCVDVLKKVNFPALIEQYVGDGFEKVGISSDEEKVTLPIAKDELAGEFAIVLYQGGTLTKVKPAECSGDYYIIKAFGMKDGQGDNESCVILLVPA